MTEAPQALPESLGDPATVKAIQDYVSLRVRYERAQRLADQAKAEQEAAKETLWELMEAGELKTINHTRLGRFTMTMPMIAAIKDPEALMTELTMLGLTATHTKVDFVRRNVNELLRERVEEGEDPPAGTEPFIRHGITWAARPDALRVENWDGSEAIELG